MRLAASAGSSLALGAVTLLLALSLLSLAVLLLRERVREPMPGSDAAVRRFSLPFEEARPVISPDGLRIAYRSAGRLWIRDLSSETPREIPGGKAESGSSMPSGYRLLAWSPDSQELVFPAENEIRRVSAAGAGPATPLCPIPAGPGAGRVNILGLAWSSSGKTVVFSVSGAGIFEVPAGGGSPKLLWEEAHADDLVVLDTPRGQALVFGSGAADDSLGHNLVVRTADGQRRVILSLETSWPELVYSPTGHILFRKDPVNSSSIWAVRFSKETLQAQGEPFLVERSGRGVSLSASGTLVYLDAGRSAQFLAWRDRRGTIISQAAESHQNIQHLSLSPDGNRVLVTAHDNGSTALWIYEAQRFVKTRFPLGGEAEGRTPLAAVWPRPGNEIYYTVLSSSPVGTDIFAVSPVDSGKPKRLALPEGFNVLLDRTEDGRYFVLGGVDKIQKILLWRTTGLDGTGEILPFSEPSVVESGPALSPDRRFIAYTSNLGSRMEIYVRPFPSGPGRWQISTRGGVAPVWGPDGNELFFSAGIALMRVRVSTAGSFTAGAEERLFDHPGLRHQGAPIARYAVSSDAKRFLVVEAQRELVRPMLRIVENWLSEFRHRIPQTLN